MTTTQGSMMTKISFRKAKILLLRRLFWHEYLYDFNVYYEVLFSIVNKSQTDVSLFQWSLIKQFTSSYIAPLTLIGHTYTSSCISFEATLYRCNSTPAPRFSTCTLQNRQIERKQLGSELDERVDQESGSCNPPLYPQFLLNMWILSQHQPLFGV